MSAMVLGGVGLPAALARSLEELRWRASEVAGIETRPPGFEVPGFGLSFITEGAGRELPQRPIEEPS